MILQGQAIPKHVRSLVLDATRAACGVLADFFEECDCPAIARALRCDERERDTKKVSSAEQDHAMLAMLVSLLDLPTTKDLECDLICAYLMAHAAWLRRESQKEPFDQRSSLWLYRADAAEQFATALGTRRHRIAQAHHGESFEMVRARLERAGYAVEQPAKPAPGAPFDL